MLMNSCPYCEQGNPADAKFCNACGGALHLMPCPRCGAVSDVTATVCYQCNGQLRGRKTDALDAALPAAETSRPVPRWRSPLIVGTAALVAITVLGYYGYRQSSPVDVRQPPAASSEAGDRSGPAGAGAIVLDGQAGGTVRAKADDGAESARPAFSPPTPLVDQAPAAASERRADRPPLELRQAKAAAGPIGRPQATAARKAGVQAPARQEVCTEAVAALGLCTMTPEERKAAEAAAALKAAIGRPATADPGKAGAQESPPKDECTEAVTALGLCTRTSTQRR